HRQAFRGAAQELAPASRAHFFSKAEVDNHCLGTVREGPDKVGHFHGGVVRIANEQFARVGVPLGVLHGIDSVWSRLHTCTSPLRVRKHRRLLLSPALSYNTHAQQPSRLSLRPQVKAPKQVLVTANDASPPLPYSLRGRASQQEITMTGALTG